MAATVTLRLSGVPQPVRFGENTAAALAFASQAASAAAAAAAAANALIGQRASLGEFLHMAGITVSPQNGGVAIENGLRFVAGAGDSSFIVYEVPIPSEDRSAMPEGTRLRVRAEFSVTPGTSSNVGLPLASFETRVVRESGITDEGTLDTTLSGYMSTTLLVRETTVTWTYDGGEPDILALGGVVQFSDVDTGAAGTFDVVLTGLSIVIESLPAGLATTSIDFMRERETARADEGYSDLKTVGTDGDYSNLTAATAAIGDRTAQTRLRLSHLPEATAAKGELPDYVDLVGHGATRSALLYPGSTTVTGETRTNYDPCKISGNTDVRELTIITKNSNYCIHSESANLVTDWVQNLEDLVLRHDGNEEAYEAGGSVDIGLRWVPAVGVGMSSGSRQNWRRVRATSLMGGGGYWHNSQAQERACHVLVDEGHWGGDDPYAADLTLSTLGSGTGDTATFRNLVLTNGLVRLAVSQRRAAAADNGADHMDFAVTLDRVGSVISVITDPGRALRIRNNTAGAGYVIVDNASTAAIALLHPTGNGNVLMAGEAGRKGSLTGWYDLEPSGHTMGARLGDCSVTPKELVLTFNDGSGETEVTHTFNANMTAVSNEDILDAINATIEDHGVAELISLGERYRPRILDQEALPLNDGDYGIHLGTMVLSTDGWATCRNAEAADFTSGKLTVAGAVAGIALEDIRIGKAGRVQVSGWVNIEQLVVNLTAPNAGDAFTAAVNADGVHGALVYAGDTSVTLQCIRPQIVESPRSRPAYLAIGSVEGLSEAELEIAEVLPSLPDLFAPQPTSRFYRSSHSGSSFGSDTPSFDLITSQDLPDFAHGDRTRYVGETFDYAGRSLMWHQGSTEPNNGQVAVEQALDYRDAFGAGYRHALWTGWGWHFADHVDPALLNGSVIDCPGGIAPGAPPMAYFAPGIHMWDFAGVSGFRMSGVWHGAHIVNPGSSVASLTFDDGATGIYIDELVIENSHTVLEFLDCSDIFIRRVVAPGATRKIVASADAQNIRIGEWIGPGTTEIDAAADVIIGPPLGLLPKMSLVDPVASKLVRLNASNNAELIDAIIDGTWTPTFSSTSPGDLSVSLGAGNAGTYQKIGKVVFFKATYVFTPTYTTMTGDALLGGLPFTSSSSTPLNRAQFFTWSNSIAWPSSATELGYTVQGLSTFAKPIGYKSGASAAAVAATSFVTATQYTLRVAGNYIASTS
jgi:hypothetical protein